MRRQTTCHILMVRPANFGFNTETAVNNAFQFSDSRGMTPAEIHQQALNEFDALVENLRAHNINVMVGRDSVIPIKPDAIFPNNWITFHQEGFVITYPMFAPSRRRERRRQLIDIVIQQGFFSGHRINFEYNEKLNRFLEGTGSVVFDHEHRIAYACLSPRTDAALLEELCRELEYHAFPFHAVDGSGQPVYHTNVMMTVGETFVVICLDTVKDKQEHQSLRDKFSETGKEVVEISLDQMNHFAGNMLQVATKSGETILVMSETAYKSLSEHQISRLESHTQILHASIDTIEYYGGGSVRCMMAEIFLPLSK